MCPSAWHFLHLQCFPTNIRASLGVGKCPAPCLAQRRAGGSAQLGPLRVSGHRDTHSLTGSQLSPGPPRKSQCIGEGCRLRHWDRAHLPVMPTRLGQSLTLASLAWCSNHGARGHGWLATGLLVEGRCRARARKPHFAQFAHPTRPGKAVTILAAGSQQQKLWAWQEGVREGETATFCKEGKRLAKASRSQPMGRTSESCFQLEAKGHHQTDPSQISPAAGQTPHTKNTPVLSGLTGGTGQGAGRPRGRLSPPPTGHTPVRVPTFPCWDWPAEFLICLVRERERTLVVKDGEAVGGLGRAARGPGFCHGPPCNLGEVTSPS